MLPATIIKPSTSTTYVQVHRCAAFRWDKEIGILGKLGVLWKELYAEYEIRLPACGSTSLANNL